MTAEEVRKALRRKFGDSRRYAVAEEVGLTTGFSHRRLDMMVLDCYHSNNFRIDGFEIKVTTADLRRELQDPEKHHAFFEVIDYYTLAVPKGVVEPLEDIIPKQWGILIVNEDGTTRYKRKPLALQDEVKKTVPRGFFASVTRAIQQRQPAEQELREAFDQGVEAQKERNQREYDYKKRRIEDGVKQLEDYAKLRDRFQLWMDDDLDKVLDEFETFRALNLSWAIRSIGNTIEQLDKLKELLELKSGAADEEGQGGAP